MDILDISLIEFQRFLIIFFRVTGFVFMMPFFESQFLPFTSKIGLSFFITLIVFPIAVFEFTSPSLWHFGLFCISEAIIGILIGFCSKIIIYSASFAGQIVDNQNSLLMTDDMEPFFNLPATVSGKVYLLLFMMIFFYIEAHHFFIRTMISSFQTVPPGGANFTSESLVSIIIELTSLVFVFGIKFAAPVLSVLIITTVVLGVLSRTIPQLHIFIVGIPLKIGISMVFLIISLPSIRWVFEKGWHQFEKSILNILLVIGG